MNTHDEVTRQRAFYDERSHTHLQPRTGDVYANRMAAALARGLGLTPEHRVFEIGAGFGRFTFSLLRHCREVVAADLSEHALATLAQARDERGIPEERCRTLCRNVYELEPEDLDEPVDFVVGFFLLHHLPELESAIARLAPLLRRSGGGIGFVEPNRRNPLFAAQVACCPDMSWREEKGMFSLSAAKVEAAFRVAGLAPQPTGRFGFFPPPVLNRIGLAAGLENWLERRRWLRPVLPMLLLTARC